LEAEAERRELIKAMDKAHLTPREVEVVYDTYFADLGGEAIAKRIKATPRQVIRIRSRAIGKLRRYFGEGGQDRWQISC
jgi:DNA-directed RNA polymerase specialized sigma subunit